MIATTDDSKELRVHCGECQHRWVAAYLPMEMSKMGRLLKGLRCPKCVGDPKKIFLGWNNQQTKEAEHG